MTTLQKLDQLFADIRNTPYNEQQIKQRAWVGLGRAVCVYFKDEENNDTDLKGIKIYGKRLVAAARKAGLIEVPLDMSHQTPKGNYYDDKAILAPFQPSQRKTHFIYEVRDTINDYGLICSGYCDVATIEEAYQEFFKDWRFVKYFYIQRYQVSIRGCLRTR